jgi:hypothetical protein
MSHPPPMPEAAKPALTWQQHVWIALPFALVAIGGAIGGACGGAAWAINKEVFQKTKDPGLRYVWTGLITVGAFVIYLIIAGIFLSLFRKSD